MPEFSLPQVAAVALDPEYNVRCSLAVPPPLPWINPPPGSHQVRYELPAGISAEEVQDRLQAHTLSGRTVQAPGDLSGPYGALIEAGRVLRAAGLPLGQEISNALSAFLVRQSAPSPTLVMGILNATPDSFSDGGKWLDPDAAVEHGLRMVEDGAQILDIGGESTRPGAAEIPVEEELRRVLPVVERLRPRTNALLSIDTRKSEVAARCLEAGADWINDVSGLTYDPKVADVVARYPRARLVLMHSLKTPGQERYSTDYDAEGRPQYKDVVADTMRWLRRQGGEAVRRGVAAENLWIDPGFGFGKTFEQNVELLRRLREYTSIGLPVLIGTSRKSSVGRMLGDLPPDQRLEGTAATVAWAIAQGAAAIRVHDVREMARLARVTDILNGGWGERPHAGSPPVFDPGNQSS